MKDLLKIMFIPIVGCIAIGIMFLFVIFGGHWEDEVENEAGKYGFAVKDLSGDVFTYTGDCDGNTYRPVCGDDGVTYDNACFAVKAGTKSSHLGQCGARV